MIAAAIEWLNAPVDGWFLMVWSVVMGGCWCIADWITNHFERKRRFV